MRKKTPIQLQLTDVKMKNFLYIIVMISIPWVSWGQYSFNMFRSTDVNEEISDLEELNDGSFLAVGWEGSPTSPESSRGLIIEITPFGDTVEHKYVLEDKRLFFAQAHIMNDGKYLIVGSALNPPEYLHDLFIAKLDTDLTLLDYKTFNFQGYPYIYGHQLLETKNGFYIAGFASDPPEYKRHVFIVRIDDSLSIMREKLFDNLGNGNTTRDIEFSNDSSDLWIFGRGFSNINPAGGETRVVFDTNFNYKYANDLGLASGYIDVEWITDTTLLLQTCYPFIEPGPQDQDIGIIETDSSFLIDSADIHYMGATDTIDYPAWSQSLDFRHPDSIFYAGDHDVFPWFYPDVYNYIMVGQLDRSLEPRFEYRFGGDRYYWTSNILATSDGGCLVAASTYDYMKQGYEKYIYIKKLKKEDLITSSPDLRSPGPLNVKLYPNPGLDHFTLNSDLKRGVFKLYSMEGKLWKSLRVKERKTKIDVPNLPSGIYYYTISSGSQIHESGKWIKY